MRARPRRDGWEFDAQSMVVTVSVSCGCGGVAFLVLNDDELQIDDEIITYQALAKWIHQTYRIMRQLPDG